MMSEDPRQQDLKGMTAGSLKGLLEGPKQSDFTGHNYIDDFHQLSALLFKLSATFLSLPARKIGNEIEKGLRLVGEFFEIDRITLTELSDDRSELDVMHFYTASGIGPIPNNFSSRIPWVIKTIRSGKSVILGQLPDNLPEGAELDRRYFQQQGVQSALGLPLRAGGSILGALFFSTMRSKRVWSDELIQIFRQVADVLSNAMARKGAREQIDDLLEFEKIVSDISATYINLPPHMADKTIEDGLHRIGIFLGGDRCSLIQFGENYYRVTHSWAKKGIRKLPASLDYRLFPWMVKKWLSDEHLLFRRPEDLPNEAKVDKQSIMKLGAKSHLSVPVSIGGSLWGAMVMVTVHAYRNWPEEVIQRFRLLGEIFANALMRMRTEQELQKAFTQIKELKEQIEAENIYLREEIKLEHNFEEIVGRSDRLKYVLFKVEQVAPTDSTVLILGETGTGKELFARAIHNESARKNRPLIKVNCATLPSSLIESELFGHEKGAYTGAATERKGRFELADGATIFLDEIGELPLELQPKLFRVLQDGEFERLGGDRTIKTNVRIIAATNRDLQKEVQEGRFRQDLWYRINIFPITVPPLRKRRDDIPLMIHFFVNRFCKKLGKQIKTIPSSTMETLQKYPWPGNIRELEHMIERAVINTRGSVLHVMDKLESMDTDPKKMAEKPLVEIEREYIVKTLQDTGGRVSGPKGAALILGLHPETLRSRMRKLGIIKSNYLS